MFCSSGVAQVEEDFSPDNWFLSCLLLMPPSPAPAFLTCMDLFAEPVCKVIRRQTWASMVPALTEQSRREDKSNQAHKYEERQKGKIAVLALSEMGIIIVVIVIVKQINR